MKIMKPDWGVRGEAVRTSKLTEEQVRSIKRRLRDGDMQKDIAADMHIAPSIISSIKTGRIWWHVKVDG